MARRRLKVCASKWATVGIFALGSVPAIAQDAKAEKPVVDPTALRQAKDPTPMASASGDIIVTARRREETAQTVPVSISVIGAAVIAKQGLQTTSDLQRFIPGVILNGAGSLSNTTYTIRGQGKTVTGAGLPSVITYVNEVPLPGIGSYAPTYDVSNVQVLKGPQGTLFGRNTTGGAVLVYTAAPSFATGGYIQGELGNLSKRAIQGAVNVPIIDDILAVRVAGDIDRRRGYTKDLTNGGHLDNTHLNGVRASILFTPTSSIKNVFIYDRTVSNTNGFGFYPFEVLNPQLDAAVAELRTHGDRAVRPSLDPFDDETFWGITNTTTATFGAVTFKNIFGYRHTKVHDAFGGTGLSDAPLPDLGPALLALGYVPGQPGVLINTDNESVTQQYSDEIQLSGTGFNDTLNWLVGGFYLNQRPAGEDYFTADIFRPTPPSATTAAIVNNFLGGIWPLGQTSDTLYTDQSKALFANVGYKLDEVIPALAGVTLNAGVRHTWDREGVCSNGHTNVSLETGQAVAPSYNNLSECRADTGSAYGPASFSGTTKFRAWTYTLGVDYKLNDNLFFYVTTRKGYRAGGLNTPLLAPILAPYQSYKPQLVTDYEIGAHTKWRSGSWSGRFNIAAFTSKFSDLQLQATGISAGSGLPGVDATNAPSNLSLEINAGSARTKGVEADALVSPVHGLTITGAITYLDEYFLKAQAPGLLQPYFQANNGFTGAPKWSFQAAVDYELPLHSSTGVFDLHADFYHIDQYYQGPALLPGYSLTAFNVQWSKMFGRPVTLTLYVDNAFNKKYVQDVLLSTPSFGAYAGNYAPPRTYGARLRFDF